MQNIIFTSKKAGLPFRKTVFYKKDISLTDFHTLMLSRFWESRWQEVSLCQLNKSLNHHTNTKDYDNWNFKVSARGIKVPHQ